METMENDGLAMREGVLPGCELLVLPGERPKGWEPDKAGVGSRHCARLAAVEIAKAIRGYGPCNIEVDGPWAIDAHGIWESLGYGSRLASLDSRYTRWVDDKMALRSQMSALIPQTLESLAGASWQGGAILLPGRVWRRDLRDSIHLGAPRQMDVWVLRPGWRPSHEELLELASLVVGSCAPGSLWRSCKAEHPYTSGGLEVEVCGPCGWMELLECGLASERVLASCGLDGWGGLALGVGLDRLCMAAKGLDDIRQLDSDDPKAKEQCLDLAPWRPWSRQPLASRDISVCVDESWDAEQVVDAAAGALDKPQWLDSIDIKGCWDASALPSAAIERLGLMPGQKNWLLRLNLRDWTSSIPREQADHQARLCYDALHRGSSLTYRP